MRELDKGVADAMRSSSQQDKLIDALKAIKNQIESLKKD